MLWQKSATFLGRKLIKDGVKTTQQFLFLKRAFKVFNETVGRIKSMLNSLTLAGGPARNIIYVAIPSFLGYTFLNETYN